jgi:hypothetical protein
MHWLVDDQEPSVFMQNGDEHRSVIATVWFVVGHESIRLVRARRAWCWIARTSNADHNVFDDLWRLRLMDADDQWHRSNLRWTARAGTTNPKKNEKHRPRNKRIQAFVPLVLLAPVMFAETIRRVNRAQLARCMEVLKKV